MGNKTREEELYTHIQTSQQQEPHTKWQKYISFISSVIVTYHLYIYLYSVYVHEHMIHEIRHSTPSPLSTSHNTKVNKDL